MTETLQLPFWLELVTAALLLTGSLFALIGAVGLLRLKDYFQRMHPPALASTIGAWCVALASIIYFSWLKECPGAARLADSDPAVDHRTGDHPVAGPGGAVPQAHGERAGT